MIIIAFIQVIYYVLSRPAMQLSWNSALSRLKMYQGKIVLKRVLPPPGLTGAYHLITIEIAVNVI